MAFLHGDGFDFYANETQLTQRWLTYSNCEIAGTSETAFNVGKCLRLGSSANITASIEYVWSGTPNIIFGTFRYRRGVVNSGTGGLGVQFRDGSSTQVYLWFPSDGSINVVRGGDVNLATVAAENPIGVWNSYQFKVVIHNTDGSVEIRKNGGATPIISISGVNTRGGTSNDYATSIRITASAFAPNNFIDDLLICSDEDTGDGLNDWLGDLRAVTVMPTNAVQADFAQPPLTLGNIPQVSTVSNSSNNIAAYAYTSPAEGYVDSIGVQLVSGITGNVKCAVYSNDGGVPGTLIAQSDQVTNPSAGQVTFTFNDPVLIPKGTVWVAFWNSASVTFVSGATQTRSNRSLNYTTDFPTSFSQTSTTTYSGTPILNAVLYDAAQHSLVNERSSDGDRSFIYSATPGDKDLYEIQTVVSQGTSPAVITGVIPFAIAKRSDSGSRTLGVKLKSGGDEITAVSSDSLPLDYKFLGAWVPQDPATGVAWTTSAVDNIQVGTEIIE